MGTMGLYDHEQRRKGNPPMIFVTIRCLRLDPSDY
jgi:hypothetical protein